MKLRLVRGENFVEALWARDPSSLWHALRRIIIPLHTEKKKSALMITVFIFFILMQPFLTLPLSLLYLTENTLKGPLEIICLLTIILILICSIIQSHFGLLQKSIYGLGFVLGCTVITASFLTSAFSLERNRMVKWRDRSYSVGTKQHPFHL